MRYSKLFGKTIRKAPKEAVLESHKLLYRAGFIRDLSAGRYLLTPLGYRVFEKIVRIIDEEMKAIGGQRVLTPTLHPLELWQATHRDEAFGEGLMQVKDRRGAKFAIGATAEAVMTEFVKKFHPSWKDLPLVIYQFSQKFRDELRARGGLVRVREFLMKDSYSFAADGESFMKTYYDHYHAYERIAERLGIKVIPVEADSGALGGDFCHEFITPCDYGEDIILTCECGYRANKEKAEFTKENKNVDEKEEELQEVEAVRGNTMEDGVKLHQKPVWQQIKDVMFVDEKDRFILAIIRGDLVVNEAKLKRLVDRHDLRHAEDEEIRKKLNSEPGFISPVGLKNNLASGVELIIVADDSLRTIKNAYGGSNKKNRDLININIERDYKVDFEGDIAEAKEGFLCKKCQKPLKEIQGIEFGHVFKYDDFYSKAMEATFTDKDGQEKFLLMGAYGIGVERAMAIIVEAHHDEKGIIWPPSVSPYQAHLIELKTKNAKRKTTTQNSKLTGDYIYKKLTEARIEVLYDDREEVSAGEKFADADLIGIPVRLVLSEKTRDKIEWKKRDKKETELLSLEEVIDKLSL